MKKIAAQSAESFATTDTVNFVCVVCTILTIHQYVAYDMYMRWLSYQEVVGQPNNREYKTTGCCLTRRQDIFLPAFVATKRDVFDNTDLKVALSARPKNPTTAHLWSG